MSNRIGRLAAIRTLTRRHTIWVVLRWESESGTFVQWPVGRAAFFSLHALSPSPMRTFSLLRLLTLASLAAALLASPAAQAQTIRRCNNVGVTGAGIFTTLQAAHDAATAGDIIYLEPSGISYGDLDATKPLTIIGNGFFHGEQPTPLVVDPRATTVGIVFLRPTAAGTRVTGLTITGRLGCSANNCIVERNRILGNGLNIGTDDFATGTSATITNGLFRQNYIEAPLSFRGSGSTTISGVLVGNNFILNGLNVASGPFTNLNSALIANNIIGDRAGNSGASLNIDNCVVKNNIITSVGGTFAVRANASNNNIGTGTQFGTANGNQQNVALASIFGAGTGSESQFQIAAAGPADNTGESGVDVGMFGGTTPYVLAGVPSIPTIFQYSQSVSGTTLNAVISTRSNK